MEFTTAKDLIMLKKQRNLYLIRALYIEEEMLKKQMYMLQLIINNNRAKIDQINQINEIEQQQLSNYSLVREERVADLTNEINSSSADLEPMRVKLNNLAAQYAATIAEITTLNTKIPQTTIVTNVKVYTDQGSCSMEALRDRYWAQKIGDILSNTIMMNTSDKFLHRLQQ